ncbi:hypothetical protein SNEBB_007355 [Seison nebaliae]|nr:hypothetical protein SNEBB_007355 [Seison nebaliae]
MAILTHKSLQVASLSIELTVAPNSPPIPESFILLIEIFNNESQSPFFVQPTKSGFVSVINIKYVGEIPTKMSFTPTGSNIILNKLFFTHYCQYYCFPNQLLINGMGYEIIPQSEECSILPIILIY